MIAAVKHERRSPGSSTTPCVLQRGRGGDRLEQRQQHRAVARVLRDLAAARLAFLAQRCRAPGSTCVPICKMIDAEMYGMMPSAKIDQPLQRAAREHVEHAQDRAGLLLEEPRERDGVDARAPG